MISVIVPVYNAEKNLSRCIDSILDQTYSDFELILLNDGSKDSSLEICQDYAKKDCRISVYSHENHGVSYTRNRGIKLAQGDYIQFIDSDDYIDKTMFEKSLRHMNEYQVDLVVCGIKEIHSSYTYDVIPLKKCKMRVLDFEEKYPNIFQNFILNSPVNKLYRKSKIKNLFPEDISLGEDLLFNLAYLESINTIYFDSEIFYFYEIDDNGLNHKYRENSIEIQEILYEKCMLFIEKYHVGTQAVKDVSAIFIRFLCYGLSDIYKLSNKSSVQKKNILKKWMYNQNVEKALNFVEFSERKYQISCFLLRHKMVFLFDSMMKLKRG